MGYNQQLHLLFCDQQQTLGHVIQRFYSCVIGGCETALLESRYNWHDDSVLLNICKTIKSQGLEAFVDIDGYPDPSVITGDKQWPDFALVKNDNLLLLELTVGFEANIK